MTGLEKILKAIEDDAKATAETIITAAKQEADEITKAAKAEADKKCKEIVLKSENDKKAVLSRAESAASLQERKIILDAKQQIINDTILKAKNSLINLPDSEYFNIIFQMVKKHSLNQPGNILFSTKDYNRLPKDFETRMKEALAEKAGATLTVSEKTVTIDGGFILVYGDVEENCSFEALFSAAKEDLQDKVNAFLFE